MLQPVFQQGKLRTAYNQARVERDRREIVFRRTLLDAVREVSDALVAIEKLETRLLAADKRQQVLDASVANATLLFKSGMADYLDVVTAQEKSLEAGVTLADIRRQRLEAVTELYRAVGGGWH
ncbi:TolC family protein [Prosthecochloris sp. GSB1]|uniref:TolC family protein n=1 Tax=Prosthecochloris sp. GSB1 TaxID=281093 RepID=UPI0026B16C0F